MKSGIISSILIALAATMCAQSVKAQFDPSCPRPRYSMAAIKKQANLMTAGKAADSDTDIIVDARLFELPAFFTVFAGDTKLYTQHIVSDSAGMVRFSPSKDMRDKRVFVTIGYLPNDGDYFRREIADVFYDADGKIAEIKPIEQNKKKKNRETKIKQPAITDIKLQ